MSNIDVQVENIGGISESEIQLSSGVSVLTGQNATNRTSFLQALMAGLGSENVSLKGDADEGYVSLEFSDDTYTRHLHRTAESVQTDGDPYLTDSEVADLFAFLLASNEARRAVGRNDDLRELIMRPVDTDAIRTEIDRLERKKRELDERIAELDRVASKIPQLKEQRSGLAEKIAQKEAELTSAQAALEEADESVQRSREDQNKLETKLETLKTTRDELESVRYDLQTERQSLDSLREDRQELASDIEETEVSADDLATLDSELGELRERREHLDSIVQQLQNVIEFNLQMLEGTNEEIISLLHSQPDGAVTDQLLPDDSVVCWSCGSEVDHDQIEATVDRLREHSQEKVAARRSLKEQIEDLQSERKELQRTQREHQQRQDRLREVEVKIERREAAIEELEARRADLTGQIEQLENEVTALEDDAHRELLDRHEEVNQLQFRLDQLADERRNLSQEIDEKEQQVRQRAQLRSEREDIKQQLTEKRTRIERIETEAIDEFNERMADVLTLLEYDNIERIWIERVTQQVRDGHQTQPNSVFELHVVRTTESGNAYEDTIKHLSESEREITGIVFALAGYLVHEVYDTVPFLLLDSLEAIDSTRISALVDYIADFVDNLVVALLPEDAAALDDSYHRVTDI